MIKVMITKVGKTVNVNIINFFSNIKKLILILFFAF